MSGKLNETSYQNIPITAVTVYQAPVITPPNTVSIVSMQFCNKATNEVDITVQLTSSTDVLLCHLAQNLTIPSKGIFQLISNRKFLLSGKKIKILASQANAIDVELSMVEELN